MTIKKTKDDVSKDLARINRELPKVQRRQLEYLLERSREESKSNPNFWRASRTIRSKSGGKTPTRAVQSRLTNRTGALKNSVFFRIVQSAGRLIGWHMIRNTTPGAGGTGTAEYGTILANRNPRWNFLNRGLQMARKKYARQMKAGFDKLMKG